MGVIERQVIVTWYTPEEKLPKADRLLIGKDGMRMSDARKALTTMMLLGTMLNLNGEYSKELVDIDFESLQDETEESEDTDEQDD